MSRLVLLLAAALIAVGTSAFAGEVIQIEAQGTDWNAIIPFILFVGVTLGITKWAAGRTKTTADFYTAGGGITAGQNSLAIAGDYMSAASFLGISSLVYTSGYDGLIYSVGFLVGWPVILFLIAEKLRNLGSYTFAEVAAYRLSRGPVRTFAAIGSLTVVSFYLIAQMVGAGQLVKLLFNMPYPYAVAIVGGLMIVYVTFGGMVATTWVQIVKACLLLIGATIIAFGVMAEFGFSFEALFRRAVEVHPKHLAIMSPGTLVTNPYGAVSLGLALIFGTAGLPHILMRFFTVPDAKAARKSVFYATGLIGYFYVLTFIIGFGAITLVSTNPDYVLKVGELGLKGGNNMAAIWLAQAIGGDVFKGFIAAVAFATILAVVSGLALAGASAIAHDLYANVFRHGRSNEADEMKVSKYASIGLGVVAVLLGIVFEKQNVAFMVGLAFAIAASGNFPVLIMSIMWKGLTTRGALWGGYVGLGSAVLLTILGPSMWVDTFHLGATAAAAPFPLNNPALVSMPLAFIFMWFMSITDKSEAGDLDRAGFESQQIRSETGLGATAAAKH